VLQASTAFHSVHLEEDVHDFWPVYFFQIAMLKEPEESRGNLKKWL